MNISSAWGLVERDGLFLFVQRAPRTSRSGQWCVPGGGLKRGESGEHACIRECKEEVGLDVDISRQLMTLDRMSFFHCTCSKRDQRIVLQQKECSDYRWAKPSDLLSVGEIMELRKLVLVFSALGHEVETGSLDS